MSWLSRIQNIKLTIITGDGKEYAPLWKEAKKNVNFNTAAFEFINIRGTFVERAEVKGSQYPILLYFQGDDCIDQANAFELSSRDKRPWTIKHPIYDEILVQPLNLSFDNSQMNTSVVTGVVWETIEQKYPDDKISPEKDIIVRKENSDVQTSATFTEDIGTPSPESVQPSLASVTQLGLNYETITESSEDIQRLKNEIRTASAAAQELISFPTRYINEAINLINFPFSIVQNIESKVQVLLNSIESFKSIFLDDSSVNDNILLFDSQSSILFTETARNVINSDENDYLTRATVLNVAQNINEAYISFIGELDTLEYDRNPNSAIDLDYIVNLSLGALFDIAFEAKQEREYILEKDDNIINLSHRFIGPGDDNLDLFVLQNNIGLDEFLTLKKGRKIIYYV